MAGTAYGRAVWDDSKLRSEIIPKGPRQFSELFTVLAIGSEVTSKSQLINEISDPAAKTIKNSENCLRPWEVFWERNFSILRIVLP
jgi:hypothetical protein